MILNLQLRSAFGAVLCALAVAGCADEPAPASSASTDGLDEFIPVYNDYIADWLAQQAADAKKLIAEKESQIASAAEREKPTTALEAELESLTRDLDRVLYRQSHDGYFSIKMLEDVPKDLVWQDGMDQPEVGDPRALKGGTFNQPMITFPPTLRRFGPKSNHGYRGYFYDDVEMPLIGMHPLTGQYIPAIAIRWAAGADGRTMFYEIDPEARYTDGTPILAKDFLRGVYVRASDNVVDPFYSQYLREQFANFTVYSERILSISVPEPKPLLPMYASMFPAGEKFYKDYGPDYVERYNWKHEPSTGPYSIRPEDVKKGRSVTLTRNKDWWLKDHKYYKNLFNVDRIQFNLIRNTSKAFEMFRAGQLDYHPITAPDYWYRRSEIQPVFDGYIERYTFYNQYPRVPRGLYLNLDKSILKDPNLRIGLAYATNWQRVIDAIFNGDFSRLQNFSEGFGPFTNPAVSARPFSITKAQEYFAKAGFDRKGADGILVNAKGEKLSIPIVCPSDPQTVQMMAVLAEEAKKAGLEYRIDGRERTSAFKFMAEKKHHICYSGWAVTPPFPRYFQFFHSSNAYTDEGVVKPDTNNFNSYADPEMDDLTMQVRYATDVETIKEASWEIQQIIHDKALFIPGFVTDFVRVGCWRWVRWPDTEAMPFCFPIIYEPFESHAFWIDPEIKKETLQAMQDGNTFPEVQRTISKFRDWEAPLTDELPLPPSVRAATPQTAENSTNNEQ